MSPQACVREIASASGVAKPTVYNHLSDKATLFRSALRALALSGSTAFPELLDEIQDATSVRLRSALADRLARLTLTGVLESRSRLGSRELPAAELDTIATAAVRTFLSAYGTPGQTPEPGAGPV